MPVRKKIPNLISNLLATCILFFTSGIIAYPQKVQAIDSVNANPAISSGTNQNNTICKKSSCNFYKTDSIFSFRSQKGYFPSLLKDFEEQATAPFKLKPKQWLMTGAAIVITAAVMHFDGDIDEWARVQKQKHNWINKSSPVITRFGGDWG